MERRTLCPSCGSRPRLAATVARNDEVIEKSWWCPWCCALIKAEPTLPQVIDHYVDHDVDAPTAH
ncbi:MAG: hypothetical protein ND807_04630 [Vicinamibacterales bacterium]|nr:hypothetical protein [Vicinamibacterales bacterium]